MLSPSDFDVRTDTLSRRIRLSHSALHQKLSGGVRLTQERTMRGLDLLHDIKSLRVSRLYTRNHTLLRLIWNGLIIVADEVC